MNRNVLTAAAKLTNGSALDKLVEPLPNGALLREKLRPGFAGRAQAYDVHSGKAHYIAADGTTVFLFTLTAVTLKEAAQVAAELDALSTWSTSAFASAVARALDGTWERVQ